MKNEHSEKVLVVFLVLMVLFCGLCAVIIARTHFDSRRFGQLQSELDAANKQLAEQQSENARLVEQLAREQQAARTVLNQLKTDISRDSSSLSERIRQIAKAVKDMEGVINNFHTVDYNYNSNVSVEKVK